MSSGGWEVVTKNKREKTNNKNAKLTKAEKKKFIENAPRVEDYLPLSQVKTLYDNLDGNNKENKTPKDKENKTKENEEKKKQQKQQNQQQTAGKKKAQPAKPKEKTKSPDKSGITVDQINELLETNKVRFPDAPLIWMKDLVSYLNANISADKEDPAFGNKSETYPLSLISKAVRSVFEKVIKSAGHANVQLFYEGTLLLMAKNMSLGLSDIGCKIFLQLLAQMYPEITIANIDKHVTLRNSYQNKKSIGLSFLWVWSQGGKNNLSVGLILWHEVMAPMLESRNYAFQVMKILKELLAAHKHVNSFTVEMYMNIIDDFCSGKINIPTSLKREINVCLDLLRSAAIQSTNLSSLFEIILDKITPKINSSYKDEYIKILSACIAANSQCISIWKEIHEKRLYQSELLIKQLAEDWDVIQSKVDVKALRDTLLTFQPRETKTKKNKEELLMIACQKNAQELIKKMTARPKKSASFPWRKGSLILLVLIGAVLTYDCRKHGSFEASSTGRLLKTSGVVAHGQNVWSMTKHYSNQGLAYMEASSPKYYKIVSDLAQHYSKLARDLYLVGGNTLGNIYNNTLVYIEEKRPLVVENFELYFPGWIETFQTSSVKFVETVRTLSSEASKQIVEQSTIFVRWLETSVFVGEMSPEKIRGYAVQGVETVQTFASQTYDWVYEKVQTLSKVQ